MATIYGNDTDSFISWSMTDSQNTAATSQNTLEIEGAGTDEKLKKYRNYWWKTGNYHPKAKWEEASIPYELATDVSWEEYVEKTDKYNIHGWWEWENGTVNVIELPLRFHEYCVSAITQEIYEATRSVKCTYFGIFASGSMSTKSRGSGKEADASYIPEAKPQVNDDGSDGKNHPWPNLVVEVAYSETEANVKNKVENYWLATGRAHDAIVIKLKPIDSDTAPSCMTAWHYCTNVRTAAGALNSTMYEFGTVDRQGNPINPQLGQNVINIQLNCLYHGVPANFVIPPLPNPIPIDLFYARYAIEHCNY
ncbi:14161_t:CDS:2 [Funneliformis geosporum]|uniref:9751_t:CDS:1 n=1 Tax=Funneliformis geosporum TaxID=1117311 RepID=A0A9W4SSE7_9GLOM|nr:14161_t:CDS:2 [Funneliformis geosporum]CAI2178844.1 9751_t:CDS:2 [Funneliformis geosporum]